jgi:hypothetical protein
MMRRNQQLHPNISVLLSTETQQSPVYQSCKKHRLYDVNSAALYVVRRETDVSEERVASMFTVLTLLIAWFLAWLASRP